MLKPQANEVRVVEPGTKLSHRIGDLLRYRELIANLVRKELRVKYKNSVLGFVWSLLNPALLLAIYWLVFTKFLGQAIPNFPIFLLSGLLGFNLLSTALSSSVTSLLGNASLVTKVYFPRESLPISAIGASLMHFFFQLTVLAAALLILRTSVSPAALVLVPAALAVQLVLLFGVCLFAAVLNVYFRDVQHLVEIGLLAWFWMTPIVYPIGFLQQNLGHLWVLSFLNPMTAITLAYQRGIYVRTQYVQYVNHVKQVHILFPHEPVLWYLRNLGFVGIAALALAWIGWSLFRRLESRLAEEL